ncbi:hypothetical protein [Mangrovivirga cuniculi]|uniref:Uncharacterized protein n=1 Tax=Mangrovivirga cuniculi TaxID=2715131 RepID=A0A4D7JVN5_9BACT|nr:hypothetical protein [Mangrovivirga cuniculi]QCK16236.1 hypothetical protein DCC35_16555 [Mangrovivirga cuniculi]
MKIAGKIIIVILVLISSYPATLVLNLIAVLTYESVFIEPVNNKLLFISIPLAITYGLAVQSFTIWATNMVTAKVFNWIYTLLVFGFVTFMLSSNARELIFRDLSMFSLFIIMIFIGVGAWLRVLKIIDNRFKKTKTESDILDMK